MIDELKAALANGIEDVSSAAYALNLEMESFSQDAVEILLELQATAGELRLTAYRIFEQLDKLSHGAQA